MPGTSFLIIPKKVVLVGTILGHCHEDESVLDIAPIKKDISTCDSVSRSIGVKYQPGSSFCTKQKVVLRLVTVGKRNRSTSSRTRSWKVQRSVSWNERGYCVKVDSGAVLGKDKEDMEQGGRERDKNWLSCGLEMGKVLKFFFWTENR